jgi:hypothetical protein
MTRITRISPHPDFAKDRLTDRIGEKELTERLLSARAAPPWPVSLAAPGASAGLDGLPTRGYITDKMLTEAIDHG